MSLDLAGEGDHAIEMVIEHVNMIAIEVSKDAIDRFRNDLDNEGGRPPVDEIPGALHDVDLGPLNVDFQKIGNEARFLDIFVQRGGNAQFAALDGEMADVLDITCSRAYPGRILECMNSSVPALFESAVFSITTRSRMPLTLQFSSTRECALEVGSTRRLSEFRLRKNRKAEKISPVLAPMSKTIGRFD